MYVVSLLGIIVSVAYRIFCLGSNSFFMSVGLYDLSSSLKPNWAYYRMVSYFRLCFICFTFYSFLICLNSSFNFQLLLAQVTSVESIMFISSLCVSALLIFLCTVARFALKSTHTQVQWFIFFFFFLSPLSSESSLTLWTWTASLYSNATCEHMRACRAVVLTETEKMVVTSQN